MHEEEIETVASQFGGKVRRGVFECADGSKERQLKKSKITKLGTWVQFHNVPEQLMFIEGTPKKLATMVGEYGKLDKGNKSSYKYVRCRVWLDVAKPLVTGFYLARPEKDPAWIIVKYERLPRFCHHCGLWSHETDECSEKQYSKARDNEMSRWDEQLDWSREEKEAAWNQMEQRALCDRSEEELANQNRRTGDLENEKQYAVEGEVQESSRGGASGTDVGLEEAEKLVIGKSKVEKRCGARGNRCCPEQRRIILMPMVLRRLVKRKRQSELLKEAASGRLKENEGSHRNSGTVEKGGDASQLWAKPTGALGQEGMDWEEGDRRRLLSSPAGSNENVVLELSGTGATPHSSMPRRYGENPKASIGDFNEILFGWEMMGRRLRKEWQMRSFREVVQDCDLVDLGYSGTTYTFSNRRAGQFETRARLDRVFANSRWKDLFNRYEVKHLVTTVSDHFALFVDFQKRKLCVKEKLFRFEPMWLRHKGFSDLVRNSWGNGSAQQSFMARLDSCKGDIVRWNNSVFGKVQKQIASLKKKLEDVKTEFRTEEVISKESQIQVELDEWFAREELLWLQRSRVDWLREGDSNTRFFHTRASQRKKKNTITKIKGPNDRWITEEKEIGDEAVHHFESIFKSTSPKEKVEWEENMSFIHNSVSAEKIEFLCAPYTEIEIQNAAKFVAQEVGQANFRFVVTQPEAETGWRPPEEGWFTVSCDGSWVRESREAGIGVVCRDSRGIVMFAAAHCLDGVSSIFEVEGLAMRLGMELALKKGLKKVIFRSDNVEIISALLAKSILRREWSWVKECCEMMESTRDWRLEHVFREANTVADQLASRARERRWSWTSMEAIPTFLSSAILRDMSLAGIGP
ncbi:hypothetical protein QQ045_008151 [Rhodiola kirilowii]